MTICESSPTAAVSRGEPLEPFCASGNSPTVHLLGYGAVGAAFHRLAADAGLRVVAVSDRSATAFAREGIAHAELSAFKRAGRPLSARDDAEALPLTIAIDAVDADVVVDATSTSHCGEGAERALHRSRAILRGGRALILAAKDGIARDPAALLREPRLGAAAVLGGTGAALQRELPQLAADCQAVALVGNATTTALIEAIERGANRDAAIAGARERGLLETDPRHDLDGLDAALKLRIVAGAVLGEPAAVPDAPFAELEPELVRHRAARGRTTRLVARAARGGGATLGWEELRRSDPLAVPSDRVAYAYATGDGSTRLHVGSGLGPDGTATALLGDVRRLVDAGGAR